MERKEKRRYNYTKKTGRPPVFSDPEQLLEECLNYFESCDENPWVKVDHKVVSGELREVHSPTQTPYTWRGLCVHLGVNSKYFNDFKKNCSDEFSDIINYIGDIIDKNKLEGAMVGAYSATIVSQLLGLKDKEEDKEEERPVKTIIFSGGR